MPGESFGQGGAGHHAVALTVDEAQLGEAARRIARTAEESGLRFALAPRGRGCAAPGEGKSPALTRPHPALPDQVRGRHPLRQAERKKIIAPGSRTPRLFVSHSQKCSEKPRKSDSSKSSGPTCARCTPTCAIWVEAHWPGPKARGWRSTGVPLARRPRALGPEMAMITRAVGLVGAGGEPVEPRLEFAIEGALLASIGERIPLFGRRTSGA